MKEDYTPELDWPFVVVVATRDQEPLEYGFDSKMEMEQWVFGFTTAQKIGERVIAMTLFAQPPRPKPERVRTVLTEARRTMLDGAK